MGKRGHSEEEILRVLREAESGDTVVEVCRKHGISQQSFYLWKKKYAGLGLQELRELRQLRDENAKLKRLVADLSLDRHILQEIIAELAEWVQQVHQLSQRRVARLIRVERATLPDGRWIRVLTVVDQFTRECLTLFADNALSGKKVAIALDKIVVLRGAPGSITVDNGTEFASKAMDLWAYKNGVHLDFIRPGIYLSGGE